MKHNYLRVYQNHFIVCIIMNLFLGFIEFNIWHPASYLFPVCYIPGTEIIWSQYNMAISNKKNPTTTQRLETSEVGDADRI